MLPPTKLIFILIMITIISLLKGIRFNFARKLKSPSLQTSSNILESKDGGILNKEISTMSTAIEEQKLLSQQFEPLQSANISAYKQKTKSAILKQLSYSGEDPSPNKLVNRPAKGAVWGLGGQLVLANKKMQLQRVRDDPEEIVKFLELNLVKNIYIHDWKKQQDPNVNRRRYSIIGSCFSARHCWQAGLELKNALNKNVLVKKRKKNNRIDAVTANVSGNKNDEWMLVQYKDFQISLMTEEQREAADLQWKWNNPVPEQVVEKHVSISMDKKNRKNQFRRFE